MAPSVSSSGHKQSTLLGFFGKPVSGGSSVPRSSPLPAKKKPAINKPDTPPSSVHRPLDSGNPDVNQTQHSSSPAISPLQNRKSSSFDAKSLECLPQRLPPLEMTPPSSSPPEQARGSVDDDVDEDAIVSRRTRQRSKRAVRYIESDDEGAAQKSDDSDRYSPQPKTKRTRVQDSSDEEFDDIIAPNSDELDLLELHAPKRSKPKKEMTKASTSGRTGKSSPATAKPTPSGFIRAGNGASTKPPPSKAASPSEQPFEFLTDVRDENGNRPNHPEYDKRTLFIPNKTLNCLTPFEKQFWAIKKKHNDTVLFFQKGKFYELYEDDAVIAHQEFGLKITDRVKMKMAGVPESSFTMFANKFLALGYKVGRVDQSETAVAKDMRKGSSLGKKGGDDDNSKIVRRELKHIYTNGTIVDAECLPDEMSSYCVSIKELTKNITTGSTVVDKNDESISVVPIFGICFLDASVAEFKMRQIEDDASRTKLETVLRSMRIKEIIHEKGNLSKKTMRVIRNSVATDCNITMLRTNTEFYDEEQTLRKLNLVFNPELTNRSSADIDAVDAVDPQILPEGIRQILDVPEALSALGAMLSYLTQLNLEKDICASRNFDIFDPLAKQACMVLDAQSLTHLNILSNEQGDSQGTLLSLVNRAVTAFGRRLMKIWLLAPLAKADAIVARQDAVEALLEDSSFQESFDIFAKSLPDIERIMPRINAGNCKARDFTRALKAFSHLDENVEHLASISDAFPTDAVSSLVRNIPKVSALANRIQSLYQDETFEPRQGGDKEFDAAEDAIHVIEKNLQAALRKAAEVTKVPKDRIRFKDVGTNEIYQVEVPIKTKVPVDWQLVSQTQSVKRYYSVEVRQLVKELKQGRETRLAALKQFQSRLFAHFKEHNTIFLQAVKGVAELDCLVSLAKASYAMGEPTCRPSIVASDTAMLHFEELRHPCLAAASTNEFIANDIVLGEDEAQETQAARVAILTGGNMAGKSTTARTTATAVILAQLGCRVPASHARLSPVDRIASRMGANDQLFRNNSTFMVEMLEASRIIKDCTPRSLVIMDELGRGTSTFDGQAIAYAVLHHLIGRTQCLCFFLTHYTTLAHEFEGRYGVANKHMQVLVDGQRREVVFTYKLIPGIAESSYGTEVAELAGVPTSICQRATAISQEFAQAMKDTESKRLKNMENRIGVATLSDFSLLFRTGCKALGEQMEGDVIDGQALGALRRQIATVIASRDV